MALTISHRCQNIAPSPTLAIDARAKEMKAAGVDVIGFGAGALGIIVTLLHEMQKRPEAKKGLATLCIGGGMGTAVVFEKC